MLGAPGSSVFRSPTGAWVCPEIRQPMCYGCWRWRRSRLYPYVAAPLDQQTCRRRFYAISEQMRSSMKVMTRIIARWVVRSIGES
jgi:hypothetical protein